MRLRKKGLVLSCAVAAVLAVFAGLSQPSGAATQTVTASIGFVTPGVVNKTSDISFPPLLPNTGDASTMVFMDTYGKTWAQQGDVLRGGQGRAGVITVEDSRSQLINLLTGNMQLNQGLASSNVICSMHTTFDDNCKHMLAPAMGDKADKKTVYLGMNVLVKDSRNDRKAADDSFTVADASSSIDVTVVYQ